MSYLRCEQTALSCGPQVSSCLQCRLPSSCTGANDKGLEILQSPVLRLLSPLPIGPHPQQKLIKAVSKHLYSHPALF